MKKGTSIGICLFTSWAISVTVIFSCRKILDQPAIGLVDESVVANKKGVEGLLIGAYSRLDGAAFTPFGSYWGASGSNWVFGSIAGTEAYKGGEEFDQQEEIGSLEKFSGTASNVSVIYKWQTLYAGIARANEVLFVMKKATDISPEERIRIEAEARFLRAFYHFEAVKIFEFVPFADESVRYENDNYHLPNDTLIWGAIERDFSFAMEHLPVKMNAPGRANKYAAEAFLAKAKIYQVAARPEKLTEAKFLLDDLIANGVNASGVRYNLLQLYRDNFNPEKKNNEESIFSVQMSVNDGSDGANGNAGDVLNFPLIGNMCCSFFRPSQYLVNHFKTIAGSGLPDLEHFNENPVTSDEGISSDQPFIPYSGPLDPRLDWTVGRRGIPYLDWGINPGEIWVREPLSYGTFVGIKNVYYKSQQERYSDHNFWAASSSAANFNLFRFADLLLLAAEVEIELGNLENARGYINRVRSRAADPANWVKNANGQPAVNYNIGIYIDPFPEKETARKIVRFERMLELGMEGHRFFDLVRWGIADSEINFYLTNEKKRTYLSNVKFRKGINERFPIPQKQIDLSAGADGIPKLKQNPGY